MRPSICFFENVEGHISLGLSNVIEDLGRMGYRTTWGIFSAAEIGAPHQRKRVFILAHSKRSRSERWGNISLMGGEEGSKHREASQWERNGDAFDNRRAASYCQWPSRPSQPQHSWEPPRVVISMENAISQRGWSQGGDVIHERRSTSETRREGVQATTGWSPGATISNHQSASRDGGEGEAAIVGDAKIGQGHRREPGDMGLEASQGGRGNDAVDVTGQAMENTIRSGGEEPSAQPADLSPESSGRDTESVENTNLAVNRSKARRSKTDQPYAERSASGYCGSGEEAAHAGETQPSLGRNPDGTARGLDYAKLCVSCDNRTDELRLLGNGVVPATAELAFRTLASDL